MNGQTIGTISVDSKTAHPAIPLLAREGSGLATQRRVSFAWWSAATIVVSAFLLFQVQPIISKMILPWFGGTPMVWTTCLLFFQTLLLFGYAYAHLLARLRPPVQLVVHLALIVGAVLLLPITPEAAWKPTGSSQPTVRILLLLLAHVGLPYFLLSSTAPLVQAWYSRVYRGRSPYRLYALSNVSSMLALLSFPFVLEPAITSSMQGQFWSLAFGLFAFLCGYLCIQAWRARSPGRALYEEAASLNSTATPALHDTAVAVTPTWGQKLSWLILPAWASMMLLAVTNHVCQDVAVIPFLWIVPLCLYLLSFILCFDSARWYRRQVFGWAGRFVILALCVLLLANDVEQLLAKLGLHYELPDIARSFVLEAGFYFAVLFLVCMLCHGELVRRKPAPRHLTSFYLMVAAGGALGGGFVAIVCPLIFPTYLEMNLGLVGGFLLSVAVVADHLRRKEWVKQWGAFGPAMLLILAELAFVVKVQVDTVETGSLTSVRSFYGVLHVNEYDDDEPEMHRRELLHGRIRHGAQWLAPDRQNIPTTYYTEQSGVGLAIRHYRRQGPLRVGAVGLGTGTVAAFGRPGDVYRFYEINPQVVELSQRYFSFLKNSPATVEIALGDARLSMEREVAQHFDVLVLDAFSGDAIPVHLLTREAFALYRKHLKADGVIAVHISNRHLDLGPVVAGLAAYYNMRTVETHTKHAGSATDASSMWMLVTDNDAFLNDQAIRSAAENGRMTFQPIRLWTDQYSNLLQILKKPQAGHQRIVVRQQRPE